VTGALPHLNSPYSNLPGIGMAIYGRRWTKVAEVVGTRTTVQVRSHAQKYEMKVEKDKCGAMPSNDGTFTKYGYEYET
jgi:GH18 family chitinase